MNNGRDYMKKLIQLMAVIVVLVGLVLMAGCASVRIPELDAQNVDFNYHREGENVRWELIANGDGEIKKLDVW